MSTIDVVMPKMGESVMEGTVLTWYKKPGDAVELDETILEIGTDKVDSEIPSPGAGRLVEILVSEGATVEVGAILARIETDVDAEIPAGGGQNATAPAKASASAPEPSEPHGEQAEHEPVTRTAGDGSGQTPGVSVVAVGETTEVVMPKMGESVMEGTVLTWHRKVGEEIALDEALLEIGTDKVDSEIPSPAGGVLVEILVPEGETVEVGTVLARIASEAQVQTTPAGDGGEPTKAPPPAPEPAADPKREAPVSVSSGDGEPIRRRGDDGRFYSPLVRSIAQEEGLSQAELESISGSGKDGRVTKADVLGYLEHRKKRPHGAPAAPTPVMTVPSPAPSGDRVEIIEMDRMRQIIAEHMVRSKATSAHVTSFAEADVSNLVRLRESKKKAFLEREGVKLTYTPFFVRAAVEALKTHPWLNASIDGTKILVKKDFHVGIAVAVGQRGLVVPVIRDAGGKNLVGLARSAAELAERARSKQLQPDDLQGGTFTVTNVGSLGTVIGTPIINQPQVAILAVGTIKKKPVVIEDPVLGDVIGIRQMMMLSLTYDHRLIDGAMAASYLHAVVSGLEEIDPSEEL